MIATNAQTGAVVLAGDANWRAAGWGLRAAAFLFGRRVAFDHLGTRIRLRIWRGRPYLVWIGEAR